jgi:uncharacterized coiled-coil protein SlyX
MASQPAVGCSFSAGVSFTIRFVADGRDTELIAEELSELGNRVTSLENRISDLLARLAESEKINARLEAAALTTAKSMQEISRHWDAVYEAMRREQQ